MQIPFMTINSTIKTSLVPGPMKYTMLVAMIFALSACGGSSDGSSTTEPSPAGTQSTASSEEESTSPASAPPQPSTPEETVPEQEVPETEPEDETAAIPSNPAACELSAIDQSMLDAVNTARAQARSCRGAAMPAVPALEWNCQLASIAQAHSADMATNNFHSHTGSNGLSMVNRVENIGYEYSRIGENIAAGQATVDDVMSSWLSSNDGHCESIMSADFTEIGAGRRINENSQYRIYWTQNFGRPR